MQNKSEQEPDSDGANIPSLALDGGDDATAIDHLIAAPGERLMVRQERLPIPRSYPVHDRTLTPTMTCVSNTAVTL